MKISPLLLIVSVQENNSFMAGIELNIPHKGETNSCSNETGTVGSTISEVQ